MLKGLQILSPATFVRELIGTPKEDFVNSCERQVLVYKFIKLTQTLWLCFGKFLVPLEVENNLKLPRHLKGQLKNIVDLIVYTSFLFGVWRGGCFVLRYLGQCRLDWQKLALELLVLILPRCWDCRPSYSFLHTHPPHSPADFH